MRNNKISQTEKKLKKNNLFIYLTLLTSLFILLEISLFIRDSELYLGDFQLIASRLKVPTAIIPGVIYFIGAQLLTHFIFIIFILILARLIGIALHYTVSKIEKLGLLLWLLGLVTVLLANQCFYPNSKFSGLTSYIFLHPLIANALLIAGIFIFLAAITIALYGL